MTGLEYIQRHIDIVKQQIKGSKIKFIITDTDPVTKVKKLQYDLYENKLQTLETIEKSLKALEIIKEKRIDIESFYTSFIEGDYDYGFYERRYGTYGKYCLTEEEFDLLKEVLE